MTKSNSQPIQALISEDPWEQYDGVRVGLIAYRTGEGLANFMASIIFVLGDQVPDAATVSVGPFLLHVGYYDPPTARSILMGLARREPTLVLPEFTVRLLSADRPNPWTKVVPDSISLYGNVWRSRSLTWSGEAVSHLMQHDEYSRAAARLPRTEPRSFADWRQVTAWTMPSRHQQGPFRSGWDSLVDVELPTFVRLDSAWCDPNSGTLEAHVEARHRRNDLSAAIWDRMRRPIARVDAHDFELRDECGHHCAQLTLGPEVGPVQLDLMLGGELHESRLVGIPPSPVRLYASLDHETQWLDRLYKKARKGASDSFEQWVHALFSLAGVSMIHFGHGQQAFPDLTGWVMPNAAIAVEVTLKTPDLNKLVELQRRVLSMRQAMSGAVPSGVVLPLMFFNQSAPEVPRQIWANAQQDGIALVTLERAALFRDAVLSGSVQGAGVIETLVEWGARG